MALFVRRLKVQDLPGLEAVEAAQEERLGERPGWMDSVRKLVEVTLREEPEGLMIAEQDGHVVGWCAARQRGNDPVSGLRYGHILHQSVADTAQRSAIGARLLKEAEAYLKSRGCEAIRISAPSDDPRATESFKRAGYQLVAYELHRSLK